MPQQPSVVDFLFQVHPRPRKPPRAVQTCNYCNGGFGMAQPNWPFCKKECKDNFKAATERPPDQLEAVLRKPPDSDDELVQLLRYP